MFPALRFAPRIISSTVRGSNPGQSWPSISIFRPLVTKIEADSQGLLLSPSCVERLNEIRKTDGDTVLRILVEGGGCSGFQYKFDLEEKPEFDEDDRIIEKDGAQVVIDETSLEYLRGSLIDFHKELIRAGFRIIDNPQADTGCSCGASFNIKLD